MNDYVLRLCFKNLIVFFTVFGILCFTKNFDFICYVFLDDLTNFIFYLNTCLISSRWVFDIDSVCIYWVFKQWCFINTSLSVFSDLFQACLDIFHFISPLFYLHLFMDWLNFIVQFGHMFSYLSSLLNLFIGVVVKI